jgi:alpha-L-rhamnosidase
MAKMSSVLGKDDRAAYYEGLNADLKHEWNEKYVQNGELTFKTQTACVLAIAFELVEGAVRENVIRTLKENVIANDYTLTTGFVGTYMLAQTLSAADLDGLAYSLLLQTKDPSWLYSVRQGATTVWERWNSYTLARGFGAVNMNSFNHYAFGSVLEWIYAYAAGIAVDPDNPGFTHFVLSPRPDVRTAEEMPAGQERITFVKAHYDSAAGMIESAWDWREGKFTYSFTIPAGTTARVEFPLLNGREEVVLNARTFTAADLGGAVVKGKAVFELGAGKYVLQ